MVSENRKFLLKDNECYGKSNKRGESPVKWSDNRKVGERKSVIRLKIGVPSSKRETGKKTDSVRSTAREKVKRTPIGIEKGMEISYIKAFGDKKLTKYLLYHDVASQNN